MYKQQAAELQEKKNTLVSMETELQQVKRAVSEMDVENEQLRSKVAHLNEDVQNLTSINRTLDDRLDMERSSVWPFIPSGCVLYCTYRIQVCGTSDIRKQGNGLFNDALNTFYLLLYGIGHMVEDY